MTWLDRALNWLSGELRDWRLRRLLKRRALQVARTERHGWRA